MEENVAQAILTQITTLANQVNTMQEGMNALQGTMTNLQDTVTNLQGTVNNMQSQITDLSIGQMKLSEKIDRVEQNLRAEIKQEVDKVRTELKAEIQEVRAELKAEIQEVREIALFNKETGETIINSFDREYKITKYNFKAMNITNMENKKYIIDHEKRISILEKKQPYKKTIPLV